MVTIRLHGIQEPEPSGEKAGIASMGKQLHRQPKQMQAVIQIATAKANSIQ